MELSEASAFLRSATDGNQPIRTARFSGKRQPGGPRHVCRGPPVPRIHIKSCQKQGGDCKAAEFFCDVRIITQDEEKCKSFQIFSKYTFLKKCAAYGGGAAFRRGRRPQRPGGAFDTPARASGTPTPTGACELQRRETRPCIRFAETSPRKALFHCRVDKYSMNAALFSSAVVVGRPRLARAPRAARTSISVRAPACFASSSACSSAG